MRNRKERLEAIRQVIAERPIGNQEELLEPLLKRGFKITQATLSRDLKELKIAKVPDSEGRYIYVLPKGDSIGATSAYRTREETATSGLGGFMSIDFSQNIAVIKTSPGFAGSIAYDIDYGQAPELLGTIAGDDTLLVVLREGITHERALAILSRYIPALRSY